MISKLLFYKSPQTEANSLEARQILCTSPNYYSTPNVPLGDSDEQIF